MFCFCMALDFSLFCYLAFLPEFVCPVAIVNYFVEGITKDYLLFMFFLIIQFCCIAIDVYTYSQFIDKLKFVLPVNKLFYGYFTYT